MWYLTSLGAANAILRSFDRKNSFKRTDIPFKWAVMRTAVEMASVWPLNLKIVIIYGLQIRWPMDEYDAGERWHQIESLPIMQEMTITDSPGGRAVRNRSVGIVFVLFRKKENDKDRADAKMYVGVSVKGQTNLFFSSDAGLTWTPVAGQPTRFVSTHGVITANGNLFLTYGTSAGPRYLPF